MGQVDAKIQKLVKNVDIFQGLKAEDVAKIFSRGMTMGVDKGAMVFHKGTVGNQMFVVLGGSVGIFDGNRQLAKLTLGDTFGEMSLLMKEPRNASAVALEHSTLLALDERLFQKLLTKRVAVQMLLNMSRTLGGRLSDANKLIRRLQEQ